MRHYFCKKCQSSIETDDDGINYNWIRNKRGKEIFTYFASCICGGEIDAGYPTNELGQSCGERSYYSKALGVHPSQIMEEKARHPDWDFRKDGAVLVKGYYDQKRKLKELGMVDNNDLSPSRNP